MLKGKASISKRKDSRFSEMDEIVLDFGVFSGDDMTIDNPTLKALLVFSKRAPTLDWRGLAEALAPLYFEGMTLIDVISVTIPAYEAALAEPRFEMGDPRNKALELLLSPVKGSCSIDIMGMSGIDQKYSVEQFYGSFLSRILSDLRLSRVDWCRSDLFPQDSEPARPSAHPSLGVLG